MANIIKEASKHPSTGRIFKSTKAAPSAFSTVPLSLQILRRLQKQNDSKLVNAETSKSYAGQEIAFEICQLSAALKRRGMEMGDRVAFLCSSKPELAISILAVQLNGAATVFLPIASDLPSAVELLQVSWIVTDEPNLKVSQEMKSKYKFVKNILTFASVRDCLEYKQLIAEDKNGWNPCVDQLPEDADAIIQFMGGFSSLPKISRFTQRQLTAAITPYAYGTGIINHQKHDVTLVCSHLNLLLALKFIALLKYGCKIVIMAGFKLSEFFANVSKHQVTNTFLYPHEVADLAESNFSSSDLSSLSSINSGGGKISRDLQESIKNKFNLELRNSYGTNEMLIVTGGYHPDKLGSVGQPLPGIEIKIVEVSTGRLCGPNETADIFVKCPTRAKGFSGNGFEVYEVPMSDGWVRTGDMGYFDNDEYLFLTGKSTSILTYCARQVCPQDIEEVVLSHPNVQDAAVIGIPDTKVESLITACVVPKAGAAINKEEIIGLVAAKLQDPKKLRGGVFVVEKIPRNEAKEVLRDELLKTVTTK